MQLLEISERLAGDLDGLTFGPPVTHVYNPLRYAGEAHAQYLERFGGPTGRVLLLGMNPGPWGMAQTGVPFGEVAAVRDWMGLDATIGKPTHEHPKRRVDGLACTRSEVSGRRLWGWARDRFGSPEAFFARFLVINWCPLAFLEESGRNRTPDKLPAVERAPLEAACDAALRATVDVLKPVRIIGVGAFAEKRARLACPNATIGRVLHPSPASPAANRGWQAAAERQLADQGIAIP